MLFDSSPFPHPVFTGHNALKELGVWLRQQGSSSVCVLADQNTALHCLPMLQRAGIDYDYSIVVPDGENHKDLATCEMVWSKLCAVHADRHSILLLLGGGVLGDLGGFCATTFMRGIRFVQIPTTLLAQVDAAVGGKVGVNFEYHKNLLGAFSIPSALVLYGGFLATLPERELRSGWAEILKHGLIADKDHFLLLNSLQPSCLLLEEYQSLLLHSALIKQKIVIQDPLEKGIRKILNFGHTMGHAIESFCLLNERDIRHGEAILAGMVMETYLSYVKDTLDGKQLDEIVAILVPHVRLAAVPIYREDIAQIIEFTVQDKKKNGEELICILLNGMGEATYHLTICESGMRKACDYYFDIVSLS